MRRCLHAFLVGVLLLSLSMDAARACWYLRHGGHARHHLMVACPPPAAACPVIVHASVLVQAPEFEVVDAWGDACGDVVAGWPLETDVVLDAPFGAADCSCECGVMVATAAVDGLTETLVEEHVDGGTTIGPASETVSGHDPRHRGDHSADHGGDVAEAVAAPQPTLAEPVVDTPAPTPAAVPVLESTEEVRQAVAFGEPERKPEPEVVLPADPTPDQAAEQLPAHDGPPAVESNIFEEVDRAAAAAVTGGEDTLPGPQARSTAAPEESPAPEATETEARGETPETAPAPAAVADPFATIPPVSREPARRWIDRSGDYAVIGTLRTVRGDGTCELESAGRTIEVSLESLSDFDRAYATEAAERLAAHGTPESGDTAGL